MSLKIGGLFAGYGGLEMGVSAVLDAEPAWFSEYDKGPSKILEHRFPGVPNHGDITRIDWAAVEPVDILTGGSPCQDLSHAGKRAGMTEGTRSNLWVAMREAIAQLRPGLVIWENVRGAYSAAADSEVEPCAGCVGDRPGVSLRALGRVLGDLSELGYDAQWHGLRAADVGAPHGRFRVFVVARDANVEGLEGWRVGRGSAGEWTAGAAGGEPALPSPRTRDTNGAGQHGDGGLDLRTAVALLPTPRAGDGDKGGPNQRGSSGDLMLPSAVHRLLPTPTSQAAKHSADDRGPGTVDDYNLWSVAARLLPEPMVGSTNPAAHGQISGDYRAKMAEAFANWGQYADAIARWEHLTREAPAPTEPSAKGNPRLSAAFSEWMMGLPAGWVTDVPGITRNEALKAIGNGVCPQQAAAALSLMLGGAA